MLQDSNDPIFTPKPTLEEILEFTLGFDNLEVSKNPKIEAPIPQKKISKNKMDKPVKIISTHLQCPNCQFVIVNRISKAKRPRKKCPACKTKREVKYWIPRNQKDQPILITEKSQVEPITQKDQKDQGILLTETFIQNRQKLLNDSDVKTVLELVSQNLYPSNIAKNSGLSKSKVTRILQKLLKAQVIKQTNKYPKFYEIIYGPKIQAPIWIQKIEDIHRVEFKLEITNPKIPGPSESFHSLYDSEFPHATKTKIGGWTRYGINEGDDLTHPQGWNIQVNRKCIICKYVRPLADITDPIATKEKVMKLLPYRFFEEKGIMIDHDKTELRAGGGHARIKTNIPHLDSLGTRQAVSIINDSTGDELFHADNSENSKSPGIETSIDQASRILGVPQQIEKNQHQVTEQIEKLQQQMTELLQSIQSMQQERSQVQDLINTLQQFTTTLQGNTKAPVEITNPSPNMFT